MDLNPGRALLSLGPDSPAPSWSDTRLVRACLAGDEQAWVSLIEKYKNLIYSIPLKYHATPQDAADIFQAVCMEVFSELGKLRKTESLRSWLITVTIHKSYHWKKKQQRWTDQDPEDLDEEPAGGYSGAMATTEQEVAEAAEREQLVRESIRRLPARCQEMIRLLFFEDPPLPYDEVARRLGLATGSIGFIRGRCLKKLQSALHEMGFACSPQFSARSNSSPLSSV